MKTILLAAILLLPFSTFAQDAEEHPIAKAVAAKLTNPKKKFTMIAKLTVKEGEAEKFIAAFAAAVEPVRKEEGCSRYELNQINGEKNSFVMYERWKSLDALKTHLAAEHTKKLLEAVMPLLDGEPEIVVLTPQAEPVKPKTAGDSPAADAKSRAEAAVKEAEQAAKRLKDEVTKELESVKEGGGSK